MHFGHIRVVAALLNAGADPNAADGRPPLHTATSKGFPAIATLLAARGGRLGAAPRKARGGRPAALQWEAPSPRDVVPDGSPRSTAFSGMGCFFCGMGAPAGLEFFSAPTPPPA